MQLDGQSLISLAFRYQLLRCHQGTVHLCVYILFDPQSWLSHLFMNLAAKELFHVVAGEGAFSTNIYTQTAEMPFFVLVFHTLHIWIIARVAIRIKIMCTLTVDDVLWLAVDASNGTERRY
ncbi:MAG: hypothetical protein K6T85_15790 [Gorillibacterium sp.]|nr:hypothetical protein [Gorillibacterium sp.]